MFVYDPHEEGRLLEQARRLLPDREVWGVMHDVMPVLVTRRGWGAADISGPGDPEVRFAVVCMPRTGSTFLCELLAAAGAGAAREHLRDPLVLVLRSAGVDHEHVYRRIIRHGAEGDVFGTKLIAHFLFDACTTQSPGEVLRCMADRGFRFVHLTRDVMDQVISNYIAKQTRVWVARGDLTEQARDRLEQVDYRFDDLRALHESTLCDIGRLDEALAGIDPQCALRLDYNELVASPIDVLQACGRHIGCAVHPERVNLAKLPIRLSAAVDLHDALRQRFVADLRDQP